MKGTSNILNPSISSFQNHSNPPQVFEMGACNPITDMKSLNLDCIRESLIRQEDTIIFSLIERSKFPINSPVYSPSLASTLPSSKSLLHFIVHHSEAIQSQVPYSHLILYFYLFVCIIFFLVFSTVFLSFLVICYHGYCL